MNEFVIGLVVGVLAIVMFAAGSVDRVADDKARQIAAAYGCDCVVARDGEFVWREAKRDD
jgi:hypothetical protein